MKTEIEAKYYPVNKDSFRITLKSLGAELVTSEKKMRRVVFDKRLNPQINGTYVRVRDEGKVIRISLKVNATTDGNVTDQKELDITTNSFEDSKALLESVGLKLNAYQENYRETWHLKNSEVVIDTWPGLDPYIEIESPTEEELKELFGMCNLDWDKKIITSVDELYAMVYGITKEKALEMISVCTFEDNQFTKK